MKPAVVADEMFPEGAGPYMDLEEGGHLGIWLYKEITLPFDEGAQSMYDGCMEHNANYAGGSAGLLMDLAANEKAVHADFFNDFGDLYDDEDLQ